MHHPHDLLEFQHFGDSVSKLRLRGIIEGLFSPEESSQHFFESSQW
jgi:hypothetical protein